jgi:dihydropteroate synthase
VDSGTAAGQGVLRLRERSFGPGQRLVMAIVGPGADVSRGPGAGGGRGPAWDEAAAMARVRAVAEQDADIVYLGGPGGPGPDVTEAEGIRRAAALVAAMRAAYPDLVIGVGAWRHETARELCAAGADLLHGDDERVAEVAAEYGAGLVCGTAAHADRAVSRGVDPARVLIDAGTGGWPGPEGTRRLEEMVATGWPVLVSVPGAGPDPGRDQGPASGLAVAAVCAWLGARVFRADQDQVRQARRVLDLVSAIRGDRPPARALRGLA